MKTAEETLKPYVEVPFRHTQIVEKDNAIKAMKQHATNVLPSDKETETWFDENIAEGCSASSAIYKFRLWLKERNK